MREDIKKKETNTMAFQALVIGYSAVVCKEKDCDRYIFDLLPLIRKSVQALPTGNILGQAIAKMVAKISEGDIRILGELKELRRVIVRR